MLAPAPGRHPRHWRWRSPRPASQTTRRRRPPCPRKLPRDATARARAENEAEFRRIVGIYRLLNSPEHTAHIERMHRPGGFPAAAGDGALGGAHHRRA